MNKLKGNELIEKKLLTTVIMEAFYRTELEFDEDVIDNSDQSIADRLGIPVGNVTRIIFRELKKKWKKLNEKIDHERNSNSG